MNPRSRRRLRCWCVAVAIAGAGCHSTPSDAYGRGERAFAAGDLALALQRFDGVAVTDLRYPEARLAAAALERRLRRQRELQLLGLQLRGEWRDDEAIAAFRGALDAWPGNHETEQLIAATELRRNLLAGLQAAAGDREPQWREVEDRVATPPLVVVGTAPLPMATGGVAGTAPLLAASIVAVAPTTTKAHASAPDAVRMPGTIDHAWHNGVGDPIGVELAQIEARQSSGELDQVLGDLFALQRLAPGDGRVTARLARLLQQRGLVRYGQGQLHQAIADLQYATELDPALQSARVLFELAAKELAQPGR